MNMNMNMNKLFQELPELFARLFEAANKHVLPFQERMDAYNTKNAELVTIIDKKEEEIEYLANELANSEAQLNGIFQMGDRMKYVLNAACHYDAITEAEWTEHLREHLEQIHELIQYQMGLSAGWEQKVETCQTFLDEARNNKEINDKKIARATEWWQVLTKLANTAFNHQSELEQPQQTPEDFRCDALETYMNNRLHELDVAIYLAQQMIDDHYSQIDQLKENAHRLAEAHQKLRDLCEQKERIQDLGAKMSEWIGRFFGGADANVHQQEHDLDIAAIMTPLQEKIDKTRSEVAEIERSQTELLRLIERKESDIEEYKEVVEQLMEVRAVVEEVVDKLELNMSIEDVD